MQMRPTRVCSHIRRRSLRSLPGTNLPRYCYKYDDFEACFCEDAASEQYCARWISLGYRNNVKHSLSLSADASDPSFVNCSNSSSAGKEMYAAIDVMSLSTEVSRWRAHGRMFGMDGLARCVCAELLRRQSAQWPSVEQSIDILSERRRVRNRNGLAVGLALELCALVLYWSLASVARK